MTQADLFADPLVAGLKYHEIDYVPCYRSEAGTGCALCFAYWE